MNSYGEKFRISIFGESHGKWIGVVLDGIPAGLPLSVEDFLPDLQRRKSGQKGTTPRQEEDIPQIVSGLYEHHTTGAPLTLIFDNKNALSKDYDEFKMHPRPGHADFTAQIKYHSFNDHRGGGHFSGRMTLPLVAAGVVAKKLIGPIQIIAHLSQLAGTKDTTQWESLLDQAISNGDSIGGIVECHCTGVPIGVGEPFFYSLESQIAHLAFSIPGVRGIEFGDGFTAASMYGSEHNDCYIDKNGQTASNGSGGINGGISNGNPIVFRVAIKPTSSIAKGQTTFHFEKNKMEKLEIQGRHDACIALRCPVIVEAIAAIALADSGDFNIH